MGSTGAGFTYQVLKDHIGLHLLQVLNDNKRSSVAHHSKSRSPTSEERSVRWEELPLTGVTAGLEPGQIPLDDAASQVPLDGKLPADQEDLKAQKANRCLEGLKILLPHIGLTLLLLLYMAGGAAILMWMESGPEMSRRVEKLDNVTRLYTMIFNETWLMCQKGPGNTSRDFVASKLWPLLNELSKTHEYDDRFTDEEQLWTDDPNLLRTRWTYPAALLYSLTVITTTGYDHVSPLTDAGRLFAVFFGLVGIPLMFITAADIGKFLSEMVTRSYGKFLELTRYLSKKFFPPKPHPTQAAADGGGGPLETRKTSHQQTPEDLLFGLDQQDEDHIRVELPIFAYFGLILGYCAIGGLLFNSYENGPVWSFIHGFFFSFNTITTIGLGNVMVHNWLYLTLIVIYCIVGLAVITMCVDLASAQLKVLFTKLHYFGRKFRGARSTFMTMSDDIREAIRIIAALKKTRPSKEQITLEDIKKFLEIEQQYMARPFVPPDIHFLKWVDDDEMSMSNRSGSFLAATPPPVIPYTKNGSVGGAILMADATNVHM